MLKKLSLFFVVLGLLTFSLGAHPGLLDERGGHNCWNQCEKWGLHPGEYHIHQGSSHYHDPQRQDEGTHIY